MGFRLSVSFGRPDLAAEVDSVDDVAPLVRAAELDRAPEQEHDQGRDHEGDRKQMDHPDRSDQWRRRASCSRNAGHARQSQGVAEGVSAVLLMLNAPADDVDVSCEADGVSNVALGGGVATAPRGLGGGGGPLD